MYDTMNITSVVKIAVGDRIESCDHDIVSNKTECLLLSTICVICASLRTALRSVDCSNNDHFAPQYILSYSGSSTLHYQPLTTGGWTGNIDSDTNETVDSTKVHTNLLRRSYVSLILN